MAAKTGVKAAVKTAAAKPAAAPKTPETVEQSTALPGVGAPADNTTPPGGATDAATGADADAAHLMSLVMGELEGEARTMDLALTAAKTTQTTAEEGTASAVTLNGWALPEISEFPATVTLDNNTRNRIAVAGANVALLPYQQAVVEVSQEQFAKLAKALISSARAHKWDNFRGLQVKYDRND